jgi:hypothetical protein
MEFHRLKNDILVRTQYNQLYNASFPTLISDWSERIER